MAPLQLLALHFRIVYEKYRHCEMLGIVWLTRK